MFGARRSKQQEQASSVKESAINIAGLSIIVEQADITEYKTDAIVNAVNTHLHMREGLSASIRSKGGRPMEMGLVQADSIKTGETFVTVGGALGAAWVIHTACLRLDNQTSEGLLRKSVYNVLICAHERKFKSLAFPALGCEMGEFPYEAASKIMAQEILRYLGVHKQPVIKEIAFVLYSQEVVEVFKKNVCDYLYHMIMQGCHGPFVTVDAIIELDGGIVMVERSNPPYGWALPGGFVDPGEILETAVRREVKEETDLSLSDLKQFKISDRPDRDPRFHTISVIFSAKGSGKLTASSDAKAANVFKPETLPPNIAFDHRELIEEYLKNKSEIRNPKHETN